MIKLFEVIGREPCSESQQMPKKSTIQSKAGNHHRDYVSSSTKLRSDTLIKVLRESYGDEFAAGHRGDIKLSTLLEHRGNAAIGEVRNHELTGLNSRKANARANKKNLGRISSKSVTLVANASVRFGAALKKLADK
jgi:hypothetical protein